jgi:effector-binding domain-containing protein
MPLNETPETLTWPETHYVFIEKVGEFPVTAPQAWQRMHQLVPDIQAHNKITGYMSLYKIDDSMVYRAGLALEAPPAHLPPELTYEKFSGGKYVRFVLTGSFAQLPEACGRVFDIITANKIKTRDGFFIENYITDPRVTPEDDLVTHILVPVV